MPVIPLKSLAKIRMGATLRGRDATRPVPDGSCRIIRIGDIRDDGSFGNRDFPRIEPNEILDDSLFLKPGDVLFPNRGMRTTAVVFDEDDPHTIVGAQFYVLHPDTRRILPDFLAWTLRTSEAARHFAVRRKGTLVQTLQRIDLEELAIPLPPLAVQEKIVAVYQLSLVADALERRLTELRSIYLEQSLLKLARTS
jgi:restriction endonuclease S subunit